MIIVRKALVQEHAALAAMAVAAMRASFHWHAPDHWREDVFLADASGDDLYAAEIDGALAGVLGFYAPENFIHSLFVAPTFQRRGVGAALLSKAGSLATGPLSLKVDEPNLSARAFYARFGFAEAGRGETMGVAWLLLRARS